jgi:MFS family permease
MGPFHRLWVSSTLSNLGDGLMLSCFPLLAASFTSSPQAVAGLTAAATAPWLLFGLPAGVIVDRLDRVRLMWVVDLVRALVLAGLWLLIAGDRAELVTLYVTVFALGVAETLFDSAAMAILPAVVDEKSLEIANGRLFAGQLAANQFVGPPIGALLFGVAAALPAAFDSATFLVSALLLIGLQTRRTEPTVQVERRSMGFELREGLRWLWGHPNIRAMAVGAALINLAHTGAMAVLVLYATQDLGLSELGYGTLFVAMAAGALTGSLTASRVTRRLGRRATILIAVATMAIGLLGIGLVPSVPVTIVGMIAVSVATEFWNVVAVSYRQHATPDHLRGRVMSAYRFIAYGSFPLGALWGGWVAATVGVPATYVIGGLMCVLLTVYMVRALGPLDEEG